MGKAEMFTSISYKCIDTLIESQKTYIIIYHCAAIFHIEIKVSNLVQH